MIRVDSDVFLTAMAAQDRGRRAPAVQSRPPPQRPVRGVRPTPTQSSQVAAAAGPAPGDSRRVRRRGRRRGPSRPQIIGGSHLRPLASRRVIMMVNNITLAV